MKRARIGMVAALIAHAAAGQATNEIQRLPEIVVTATRRAEAASDLPFTTETYDGRDIRLRDMSRTTPDILNRTPGVMVQKTSHGQGSPFIRGFTGFRTLLLIDGIRLNNSVFRDGPNQYWNTVDSFTIRRLELVQGPGAVQYGSDAVGGTVNILPFSPFEGANDSSFGGRAHARYSSAEDSYVGRLEGRGVLGERVGGMAGLSLKRFGDLRAGGDTGRQPKTGYDETDFDARIEAYPLDEFRLTLAHQTVMQRDAWRTHSTIHAIPFEGTDAGKDKKRSLDQERHLTYARLSAEDRAGVVRDAALTLSWQRQQEDQRRIKKDDTGDKSGFEVDTLGVSLQLASPSEWGDWIYGLEYYRDFVDSYSHKYKADGSYKSSGIQGPVADDSSYDNAGAYVENTRGLLEDRLDLILGARYSVLAADAGAFENPETGKRDSFSENWNASAGSARLLYRLLPEAGVNLFAGVSQAFRAPNLSDLTRLDIARSNEIETPSTDLDPERYTAYEAGVKVENDRVRIEAAYYYTAIRDMIVRAPTGRTIDGNREVTKKNSGDGHVQGITAAATVEIVEGWSLWGNLSWMDGQVDVYPTSEPELACEPIDRLMPLTGNLGLRFQPSARYWAEAFLTAADRADRLSTRDREDTQRIPPDGTPGYAVISARGGWNVSKDLALTVALENIADRDYRIHGSGLNEPGRNLVVAAEYTF